MDKKKQKELDQARRNLKKLEQEIAESTNPVLRSMKEERRDDTRRRVKYLEQFE